MRCYNCGAKGTLEVTSKPLITRMGDVEIQDRSVPLKACRECGNWALSADVLQRAELRAAIVALTDLPQMTGERLRAVRKVLGLTQRKLGEKLGMAHETLSRFENAEEPAPDWLRAAMLGLVSEQLTSLDGHESIELLPLSA